MSQLTAFQIVDKVRNLGKIEPPDKFPKFEKEYYNDSVRITACIGELLYAGITPTVGTSVTNPVIGILNNWVFERLATAWIGRGPNFGEGNMIIFSSLTHLKASVAKLKDYEFKLTWK